MAKRTYSVEEHGPQIERLLRTILDRAGLALQFTIGPGRSPHPDIENPNVLVDFSGPDLDLLLQNRTELMLALEHLAMEHLRMASDEHSQLCFDADDHRMLRLAELRLSALTAAERVKKSLLPYRFNPMNSRERRVLHLALSHDAAVRSESAGAGPERAVVIYPAGMKAEPPPAAPGPVRKRR